MYGKTPRKLKPKFSCSKNCLEYWNFLSFHCKRTFRRQFYDWKNLFPSKLLAIVIRISKLPRAKNSYILFCCLTLAIWRCDETGSTFLLHDVHQIFFLELRQHKTLFFLSIRRDTGSNQFHILLSSKQYATALKTWRRNSSTFCWENLNNQFPVWTVQKSQWMPTSFPLLNIAYSNERIGIFERRTSILVPLVTRHLLALTTT